MPKLSYRKWKLFKNSDEKQVFSEKKQIKERTSQLILTRHSLKKVVFFNSVGRILKVTNYLLFLLENVGIKHWVSWRITLRLIESKISIPT